MSQFIPFRLTDNNQFTPEELTQFFNKHSSVRAVFEISKDEQPHYHGFIQADVTRQAVVVWLKKELHCKGNKDYSMTTKTLNKENDTEGYYRYMCKGTRDVKPKKYYNVSEEWVDKKYHEYWEINKQIIESKKSNKDTLKTKLIEYIREHEPYEYDCKIVERILEFYKEKDMPVSSSSVENYYHYVKTILFPDYLNIRAHNIYSKIIKFEN